MPRLTRKPPAYSHHRPSGQARVRLGGRDFYLGPHGSEESRREYDRVVSEWLAAGRQAPARPAPTGSSRLAPDGLTVTELVAAYWRFVDSYYVKDGEPTSEVGNIRLALRPVTKLYGHVPAREFGPLALKTVRESLIAAGLVRKEINKRVGRIVRCFKWGVENELVPPDVHQALKAVSGLRKGRSAAPEGKPVRPVPAAHVEGIRAFVTPPIWAMVQAQLFTGMRPGEVIAMRTGDIDRTGDVWAYVPRGHKMEHHDRPRTVYIGPRAQEILRPWLKADPDAHLFSPRHAMEARAAERRAARKTPLTPSQRARRRKARPKRAPRDHYAVTSYAHAIADACKKAGVPHWHPHQLRHSAATHLRREFGLEVARVILGHGSAIVTEIYAESDRDKAVAAMRAIG